MEAVKWTIPTHIVYSTSRPRSAAWTYLMEMGAVRAVRRLSGLWIYFVHAPAMSLREVQALGDRRGEPFQVFLNRCFSPEGMRQAISSPRSDSDWGAARMKVPELWSDGLRGAGTAIGFVDSGVDPGHESMTGVLASAPYFDCIANTKKNDHWDRSGHGTAVASIALGRATGQVQGIAPGATGIFAGVMYSDNKLHTSFAVDGLSWLIGVAAGVPGAPKLGEAKLRVINLSLAMVDVPALAPLYQKAEEVGVLIVVSAGTGTRATPPATYTTSVAVGAVDYQDKISSRSPSVDPAKKPGAFIVAPGVNVLAANCTEATGYVSCTGTSFAAPAVSGIAALLLEAAPHLTPAQLREILAQSADDLPPAGWDPRSGTGLVDAQKALVLARAIPAPAPT